MNNHAVRALLAALLMAPAIAPAEDWRLLATAGQFQSMIDMQSAVSAPGNHGTPALQQFTLRRAFHAPQTLPAGRPYRSTRVHYVADCAGGRLAPVLTAYYGDDYKLVHSEQRAQPQLAPPGASDAAEALALACQRIAEGTTAMPRVQMNPAPGSSARGNTSGSGIIVSEAGQVLTNHHVVQACDAHEVVDEHNVVHKATLQAADTQRDLALLAVNKRFATIARVRGDITPRLGEAVAVVGYPLGTLLGSKPTVGFGHVSSTAGVRDDPAQMQISVPIQRGNSGGPVFDQAGNIIGVVAAKLDALKIAESMGDLPQNVNFAIRGEVMRAFLETHRVNFALSRDSAKLETTDIASQGAAVTVRVRCVRRPVVATAPGGAGF